MLRFVLAILALIFGLHIATPTAAQAQDVWIQIEAKPSLTEAEDRAQAWAAMFDGVNGFVPNSGWHVIALGPYPQAEAEARLAELLRENLAQLKAGQPVECPVYDFKTHSRLERTHTIQPAPIILVDGVLLLSHPSVTASFDLRIFVEASADMRLIRRLERDLNERGRPLESSLRHYLSSVRDMHDVFVEPARSTAHAIIPNDRRGQATESIRQLVEFALRLPRNSP